MDQTPTAVDSSTLIKRHWYPAWWVVSWLHQCSVGRKIAALVLLPLFLLPFVGIAVGIAKQDFTPGDVVLFVWITLQFTWPFLLVVAAPTPTRNGKFCCAGCGQVDSTLRLLEYTVGFALLGLIPIYGTYERPLCSLCRRLVYRIVIISQNLFAVICIPVGTVMGIIWLVKNNRRPAIKIEDSLSMNGPHNQSLNPTGNRPAS